MTNQETIISPSTSVPEGERQDKMRKKLGDFWQGAEKSTQEFLVLLTRACRSETKTGGSK